MSEILLEHAELLALLDAIKARAVVSIAPAHLFPSNINERNAVLEQGQTTLEQQGLLHFDKNGTPLLDAYVEAIINTVAHPNIAILVIHNDLQEGLQRFWFYQTERHIVEHTFIKEQHHRLTELADVPALLNRMADILTIKDGASGAELEIDQNAFFTVKDLARQHEHERAMAILQDCGFVDQSAVAFLHVLEQPISADNIAFLRCGQETVIDGRNVAVLHDEQSAWSVRQNVPGVPVLVVETTDAPTIKERLRAYFEELSDDARTTTGT